MKILVVDDSATIRKITKDFLIENAHTVIEVASGEQALEYLSSQTVDLILMDVEMEGLSGYDTAKKIRALQHNNSQAQLLEDWVPIIFLSSHADDHSLALGIEAGGDDYIFKPFSKVVLNAKLLAMDRIYQMRKLIISQKVLVDQINQELLEEQNIAKNIYDNIVQYGVIKKHEFIRTYVVSKSIFNGDLALVAKSPSDNYYIIVGDFTGHGLSAALGIIPAAEVFLKLTFKGFTLEQLLIELNFKLHNILPSNIFCAAVLLEVDLLRRQIAVWNGWAPEVLCVADNGEIKKTFRSTNMPLGSLAKEKFNCKLDFINLDPGDRVYIYSDGFVETKNSTGQMFGVEGIKASIVEGYANMRTQTGAAKDAFELIIDNAIKFRGNTPQQDDLTLIEIKI